MTKTRDEDLIEVVAEYLHWRKVNPHIKGGENYLKRLEAAGVIRPPVGDEVKEFEKYATAQGLTLTTYSGIEGADDYAYNEAKDAYGAWKARAALSVSKPAMGELSEDEIEHEAKRLFNENKDSQAAPWEQQWVKTKQLWREQARQSLAATTLSPKGDVDDAAIITDMAMAICDARKGQRVSYADKLSANAAFSVLARHQARLNGEG